MKKSIKDSQPGKRLSPARLVFALVVAAVMLRYSYVGVQKLKSVSTQINLHPWFGPYVDVTSTPLFPFEQLGDSPAKQNLVLSFIVSDNDSCTPSWGNAYSLNEANDKLDLDRRIARYRQLGGDIVISFGGQRNNELAIVCKDPKELQKAYMDVIDRYEINTVDFDIEGEALKNTDALKRRAQVISDMQKSYRSNDKKLAVWLTLPASTQGLNEDGTNAVSVMLSNGVDLAGVNAMVMDFGQSRGKNQSMQSAAEDGLNELHRQLGILYKQAGIYLNQDSIWQKIGATVMIGQNDFTNEIFTQDDANGLNKFVTSKNITRMSFWSANRDVECGDNYVNTTIVSDSCSGIKQDKLEFSSILSRGFEGNISSNASNVTKEDKRIEQMPDNPNESPYQIWTENGVYLEGTKVVWHHNVYQAKWWTKGDLPDNPVLQSYETPWTLIGPVLPGEKPIPQPTLPAGTYPTWSGTEIYDVGARVLFSGVPYEAKWWTQGDSPAASTSNPDSSPWKALTQEQIEQIINDLGLTK